LTFALLDDSYNIFRWYRSGLGRYTTPDPAWNPRSVSDLNGYAYVAGNPLGYIDPLGLVKWNCGFVVVTVNSPVGPGAGGYGISCERQVGVCALAGTIVGGSAGPLPFGVSGFNATLEDGKSYPDAKSLVGKFISVQLADGWVQALGVRRVVVGAANSGVSCSPTWFGGIDVGLDIWFGYSWLTHESTGCCK